MRGSSSEKELVIPAHKIKSEKIKIIRQLIAAGFTVDQIQKMMEEKLPDNLNL
jgi:hypothetical protein